MKKMKRIAIIMLMLSLLLALAGCGSKDAENEETDQNNTAAEEEQSSPNADAEGDTLVIYFSATGTTKGIAQAIASVTGADTYEIIAAEPYSLADLDYNDSESRTTKEQNDPSVRPEIASDDIDLSKYSTIFLGYPIWFGQEPRIIDTFVEGHDFDGKTVIPFCTSGSSDIGSTGSSLAEKAGKGDWQTGKRFAGGTPDDEVRSWIESLGL